MPGLRSGHALDDLAELPLYRVPHLSPRAWELRDHPAATARPTSGWAEVLGLTADGVGKTGGVGCEVEVLA